MLAEHKLNIEKYSEYKLVKHTLTRTHIEPCPLIDSLRKVL